MNNGLSIQTIRAAAAALQGVAHNTPLDRKALELISQEASRRLGIDFKIINMPSERSLQLASQGEIDGEG